MSGTPIMAKATAVWLCDNTTMTFKQIADFCALHELEVQGIADGDVAAGELLGEGSPQTHEARLGGGVVGLSGLPDPACDGRHEDDPTPAGTHHGPDRPAGDTEATGQVGIEHL